MIIGYNLIVMVVRHCRTKQVFIHLFSLVECFGLLHFRGPKEGGFAMMGRGLLTKGEVIH